MSKNKNDIEAFKKYLSDEMDQQEAHDFEKSVLVDPFEQDALDGLESIPADKAFSDIDKLKVRVKKYKKGFKWMKLAAAIALLIVSAVSVWIILGPLEKQQRLAMENELAQEEPVKETHEITPPPGGKAFEVEELITGDSVENATNQLIPIYGNKINGEEVKDKLIEDRLSASNARKPVSPETVDMEESEVLLEEIVTEPIPFPEEERVAVVDDLIEVDESALEMTTKSTSTLEQETSQPAPKKEKSRKKDRAKSPKERTKKKKLASETDELFADETSSKVTGQVIDENGDPLPGVTVMIKGTTLGTTTDIDGNYVIEKASNSVLLVSFVGFTAQEIQVGNRNQVDVTLNSDVQALEEVVVVGYGGKETEPAPSYAPAAPSVGNKRYKNQIERNLKYPEEARLNKIEGTVVLELTINPSGGIQNIKVKKSLGYGCDEEAIRLVNEGTGWTPANRNGSNVEDKVRVKIKFKIPE
ncbi:MAG: TonB family protein [Bacteroidota bacterium]